MPTTVSRLAEVHPNADIGDDVDIGPFCLVGPDVRIGDGSKLSSHVVIIGHTTIGKRNRFFANAVIGGEPQDIGYRNAPTYLEIGDDNVFREGVTVNRGAEKEDHITRIGNRNVLMANSHVAHNCNVRNNVFLINGVLLGGHVHVHDGAIVSGNAAVHPFSTLGTLSYIGGVCRIVRDVPPFMLASGDDKPVIKTINRIGMERAGISRRTINVIRQAHNLLFRRVKSVDEVRSIFEERLDGIFPFELSMVLASIEQQQQGTNGRAREAFRDRPPESVSKIAA